MALDIASVLSQNIDSIALTPPTQADMQRVVDIRAAWKAYRGQLDRPLKVAVDQPDDNVLNNRCRPIVDKGVSWLFGAALSIECIDDAGQENQELQDFVDHLWGDDDERMTLLGKLALNGGVCGQAFIKLIPPIGNQVCPRIVVLDPAMIRVITAPDDCDVVLAFIIEYVSEHGIIKRQVIQRVDPDGSAVEYGGYDPADTWKISNYIKHGGQTSAQGWIKIGNDEDWEYPFPPIFSCQNLPNPNQFWGTPDLTPDLVRMNNVLNFLQSNVSRILKFHAHPKTWVKGVGPAQISIAVDETIVLSSDTAEIGNLEMKSDLRSSLEFIGQIRSDMDEQSRVPAVALGRMVDMPKGNISGVALELLFQPLIEKTRTKQRLYGHLIRCITRAALCMMDLLSIDEYLEYAIDLHWQNLLPIDNLQAAQTAQLLQLLGVSRITILQQLGYDPDDEADKAAADPQNGQDTIQQNDDKNTPQNAIQKSSKMTKKNGQKSKQKASLTPATTKAGKGADAGEQNDTAPDTNN